MLKPYSLIVLFCVLIGAQKSFAGDFTTQSSYHNFQHISVNIQHDTLSKKQIDSLAKRQIDSLTKALATEKSKEKSVLQKLIKPFQFKTNRKIYFSNSIHDYIVTDSIQAVKKLANLNTAVSRIQTGFVHLDKNTQTQLDSLKQNLQQSIKTIKAQLNEVDNMVKTAKAGGGVVPTPVDTPAVEKNKAPVIAANNSASPPKTGDTKAQEKKLETLRLLYNGPITYNDTSKKKDTVFIKTLTLGHQVKILGFYADTSRASLRNFNFKLISNFVYAINAIEEKDENAPLIANKYIIDSALRAKCEVTLSIYNNKPESIASLLNRPAAITSLIQKTLRLLRSARATGININFNGVGSNLNGPFLNFITELYNAYQATPQKYKISITVPADDKMVGYHLSELSRYTTNFIIDFSKRPSKAGPLEPLDNGDNYSVETCMSLYLNQGIDPAKFILGVSYSGVVWQSTHFMHYITYNMVRANYSDVTKVYNEGESAVHIQSPYKLAYLDIWYDDEITLGEKYDYALKNAIGGVAIKSLGDDNGYAELQKELAYKLLKIDTATVGLIIIKHNFTTTITTIVDLLTKNPCDQEVPPGFSKCLLFINLFLILLLAVSAGILYYNVRKYSESWKWRKQLIYLLLGLFIVWSFFLLMWLFFSSNFPYFGPNHNSKTDCVTVPFIILYLVLTTGIGIGILTWWLYRLNNEEDVP